MDQLHTRLLTNRRTQCFNHFNQLSRQSCRTNFQTNGIVQSTHVLHMSMIELSRTITNPNEMCTLEKNKN